MNPVAIYLFRCLCSNKNFEHVERCQLTRFLTPRNSRGAKNPGNAINSTRAEPARAWGTNLNSMGCLNSNFDGFKKWVGWNDFKFFFSEIKSKSSGPRRSLRGFQTLAKRFFVGRFVVFFS